MSGKGMLGSNLRVVGLVAVAVLAGAAVVAGMAVAHDKTFSNSVTLTEAKRLSPAVGVYGGRVRSPNPRCPRVREVQVYRADVNPEVRLFATRTQPGGRWRRKGPALPNGAKVYALIETKVLRSNAAHDHVCPVDRSPVRTIPYP
jgi:hypothetical protein